MSKALVRRETIAGYLFMIPSLIFFVGFVVYPMVLCIYTSLFDSTMGKEDVFIGFANYKELVRDPIFLGALKNTLIIVLVSVPTVCAFSLWVGSAIYKLKGWLRSLYRCVFYLPVVTGSVAVTVVWKWMFNNYYGIFNYVGKSLGIIDKNINWLGDERFALGCIILILFTTSVGQPIVLYVSALGNVDHSLVEAAEVDGASRFQRVLHIDFPALLPTITIMLILRMGHIMGIGFEKTYLMQNSLNLSRSEIISTFVYKKGLGAGASNDYSYSTAISMFNSVINLILITVVNQIARHVGDTSLW